VKKYFRAKNFQSKKCVGKEKEDSEMYLNVITEIYFKGDEKK
jgi:hypothetical protein